MFYAHETNLKKEMSKTDIQKLSTFPNPKTIKFCNTEEIAKIDHLCSTLYHLHYIQILK